MIENAVRTFMKRHSFDLSGKAIAVGVSGGPDSLALLHYLWSQREQLNLKLIAVHVDHMFRGEESYQEGLFVARFCKQRNIPFEMERMDVPKHMKETGLSSQQAARELRYSVFRKVMERHHLTCLALGHHGDDQIETVLMRLTRGSSGKARAGIPFSRKFSSGTLIRPFLCLTKDDLEEYCRLHTLEPRRDPSNDKDTYGRNRFRHRVIPFLKGENPQVHEHFQRFSEETQEDEVYLAELTARKMNTVMEKDSGRITVDIPSFQEMPMPLQRRGIKLILNYLYEEKPSSLSAVHIDKIFSIIRSQHPSGSLDFPKGLKVVKSYRKCQFLLSDESCATQPYWFELDGPGTVVLPSGDTIEARMEHGSDCGPKRSWSICFDAAEVAWPIVIRTREAGDRMTLLGMDGTKKIKDIFINEKIPLSARDAWPVVTDSTGRILWLPGLKKSSLSVESRESGNYMQLLYNKY
ncbi:tRNA lysidine(34) synthetase TilS [Mesobacillus zeae]|uniref:tRNA(Ile)-lysidine synthase n=1 Tax=Mesobacillus zeae TaxID=1917180 RepID=A0A398BEX1_9BACI|nr:tRNA lysidine(34) synthetase TilS [Mesobacillus zeae]RID88562.1 tRNA lysidine(34) synthetase TilS [Mesobacillus zeae]